MNAYPIRATLSAGFSAIETSWRQGGGGPRRSEEERSKTRAAVLWANPRQGAGVARGRRPCSGARTRHSVTHFQAMIALTSIRAVAVGTAAALTIHASLWA